MTQSYTAPESLERKRACQAAFVQDVLAACMQRPAHLMCFHQVSQQLQLSNVRFPDPLVVVVNLVVGRVDRCHDFSRAFLPMLYGLQDRWQRIAQLVVTGRELPPIKLHKVGRAHFVRDGNHRVSVTQHYRVPTIKAYVWECETDLLLEPGCNVDKLLCSSAHRIQRQHDGLNGSTLCGPVVRTAPGVPYIDPHCTEGR